MQTYTEDSCTIYEGLEGEVEAYKLAPHAGQSFHGVAKAAGAEFVVTTDSNSAVAAENLHLGDEKTEQQQEEKLTLIRLQPYVTGTEPSHIAAVETVPSTPSRIGGLVQTKTSCFASGNVVDVPSESHLGT